MMIRNFNDGRWSLDDGRENTFIPHPSSRVLRKLQLSSGFTLIEILLVVIIIGALAAMVVPRFAGRSEQAKKTVAQSDIETNLATALKLYELDNGNFPTTTQGLGALQDRPTAPPVPKNWQGPYIEHPAMDPWGRPYQYSSPGEHRSDYDLFSKGKDEAKEDDDIVNWK